MVTFPYADRAQADHVKVNASWLDDTSFGFTVRIKKQNAVLSMPKRR
jgi:hypothetical protein